MLTEAKGCNMLDTISIRIEAVSKTTNRAFSISPQSHCTLLALPHPLHPSPLSSQHTVLLAERELVLLSTPRISFLGL